MRTEGRRGFRERGSPSWLRRARRRALAAEEHVLHDVEVVAEREVLVDDLDAQGGGVARAVDGTGWPSKRNLPGIGAVDPSDTLDQRGLAGAVVTDEGGDLTGVDREVDVVQHLDRTELLFTPRSSSRGGSPGWVIVPLRSIFLASFKIRKECGSGCRARTTHCVARARQFIPLPS